MSVLLEIRRDQQKIFDYVKAFDKVEHQVLFNILQEKILNNNDIQFLKYSYRKQIE